MNVALLRSDLFRISSLYKIETISQIKRPFVRASVRRFVRLSVHPFVCSSIRSFVGRKYASKSTSVSQRIRASVYIFVYTLVSVRTTSSSSRYRKSVGQSSYKSVSVQLPVHRPQSAIPSVGHGETVKPSTSISLSIHCELAMKIDENRRKSRGCVVGA